MDFELSDDQEALRDAGRALLAGHADPGRVRAVVDAGGGTDRELWAAMADQGWTGLTVPDDLGGLGLGTVEAAVLLEEVGRHLAPAPVLQHLVATHLLAHADTVAARGRVPALAAGEAVGTVAWGADVDARPVTDVGPDAPAHRLTGTPEPVVYGPSADLVLVHGLDVEGTAGVYLVAPGETGPVAEPAMDRTRELGWLHLDDTPAERIGGPGLVESYLDLAATAYSAELLGLGAAALDLSVAYAKEREQFGRPIGSFQAVKHRCADMLVDVEGMRSVVYHAAWAIGSGDPEASVAASTAKAWCSDAAMRVLASALQVHGGIGFTWEDDTHLLLKRGQLDQVTFGDASFHRSRLARLLRDRVAAGEPVI